jgi:hypothetical protein
MEHTGILVDRDYLDKLNAEFGAKMALLERTIQELAGEELNVNSNLQLQRILFEKLALPKTRKIKTGYSTDAAELEKLADSHPIIASLLEYREVAKLKNGFSEMLLAIYKTFRFAASLAGRFAGRSSPRRATCSFRRITRKSSCVYSRIYRRTRPSAKPSARDMIFMQRLQPRSMAST